MFRRRVYTLIRLEQTILLITESVESLSREQEVIRAILLTRISSVLYLRESGTYTYIIKMVEPVSKYNSFTSVFIMVVLRLFSRHITFCHFPFSARNKTLKYLTAINPESILAEYLYTITSLHNRFYPCEYIPFSL